MTTSARQRVAAFWDTHIAAWLSGEDLMPSPLPEWFESYKGTGPGKPTLDGFPEPYHGDLLGLKRTPRVVVLGLNPGEYQRQFQSRNGIFAKEIEKHGSYSNWATTGPYNRSPWEDEMGINRYYQARLRFTRNWLQDPSAGHPDLLIFESYPWHSTSFRGRFQPPREAIEQFVWQPIAELPVRDVFAFGRSWHVLAKRLELTEMGAFDAGGPGYGSSAVGRKVRTHALPSGQRLVVVWQPGYAGPPSAEETDLLRDALRGAPSVVGGETRPVPGARASSHSTLDPTSAG
ncbi:anti-phage DNA glycosylase Brig1 [Micromonospora sp. BQ11]|uniref:anti-phage DNA glycosylase Brig1 n=1 Tax=Micromonospora sp. BQ11 TaxID=3452212 RepID=UPI003F8898DA